MAEAHKASSNLGSQLESNGKHWTPLDLLVVEVLEPRLSS